MKDKIKKSMNYLKTQQIESLWRQSGRDVLIQNCSAVYRVSQKASEYPRG